MRPGKYYNVTKVKSASLSILREHSQMDGSLFYLELRIGERCANEKMLREHPHMTSDDFGSFLTYLPTLIR